LCVIGGVLQAIGMPLCRDGFAFDDAQQMSTEDEVVRCSSCSRMFSLSELNKPEPPATEKKFKVKGD
jgi:hypothetical protein